ncbi:hypothetical protein CHS0354_015100, partial [Potamilus streckersoni]
KICQEKYSATMFDKNNWVYHVSDTVWLRDRLSKKFPQSLSFNYILVNKVTGEPLCKNPNVTAFLQCKLNQCSTGNNNSVENDIIVFMRCLLTNCASLLFGMPQSCLTCFFLFPDPTEALNVCMNPNTGINVPGLLLLSKYPFNDARALEHHKDVMEIAKQGYLVANIKTIGTVICTHFATRFLEDLYPEVLLPYANYASQNLIELRQLLEVFKHTKPLILTGDFNTGPQQADKDVCEYNPESYKVLTCLTSNLEHTILDKCTYCKDNTWSHEKCNVIIDHVFVRGITIKEIKRIFDQRTVKMDTKSYHVSDHYGVMATILVGQ